MIKNIIVKTEELLPSLSSVVSVVNAKNTIPALGYVFLHVRKNPNEDGSLNMVLLASDNDLWLKREVKVEQGSDAGTSFCVDAKTFLQTMNALNGQVVTLEADIEKHKLNCNYGNGIIELPLFDTEGYPMPLQVSLEGGHEVQVKSDALMYAITKVGYAIANDTINVILNGVNVEFSENRMTATATDKRMFSKYTSNVECNERSSFALPSKPYKLLVSAAQDFADNEISIAYDDKIVVIKHGDFMLTTRLLDGNYPDLNKFIPKNYERGAKFDKQAMLSALKRVSVASNESNLCVVSFVGCTCTVKCEDLNNAKSGSESIICEYEGDPFSICLSTQYLQQTLQSINADNVKMTFDTPMKPALFYDESEPSESEYIAMVMPMKAL